MSTAPPLSLDDAVLRLKAEIIAQDWRLSPKRAAHLDAAFASLRGHFRERRAIHAMLVMAANVLAYIKGHGTSPPETIDFLKEAMAHVVSLHEELAVDLNHEEEVLQGLFARFNRLKEKIQRRQRSPALADRQETQTGDKASPRPEAEPEPAPAAPSPNEETTIPSLIAEFRAALVQAHPPGPALAQLLDGWLATPEVAGLLRENLPNELPETPTPIPSPPPPELATSHPATPVRVLTINALKMALPCRMIAMSRPISPAQAAKYTQNATVPLADFARLLRRLSCLFAGNLARVKEKNLRQLSLPLLLPRGYDLPETPAADSRTLVVVSNGNWHGALVCDAIEDEEQTMHKLAKRQDGDLSGLAHLDNGTQIPLLDAQAMLQREGILLML